MAVPRLVIPHNRVCLRREDGYAVEGVVRSGQIGQGPHVAFFEDELAERFRPGGEAVCVSSGTAALRLASYVCDSALWTVSTYACVALFHALSDNQTVVEPIDCRADTLDAPAADVVVHTYGVPCPVAPDRIEDFTHAPGATVDGKPCGSMGALSVISFGATKPLGCGVGGAALGPRDLIETIRDMRDYDGKREFRARFNWQASEFAAALGRRRLARLDEENAWRREVGERYAEACRANGIAMYGGPGSTFYRFVIRVPDTEKARAHFAAHGVETICPLERWELLHVQLGQEGEFPNAEDAAVHALSLPIWPGMQESEVARVVEALKELTP